MSKVYGFCKAGCKYPVVSEEDWLKSIPSVEIAQSTYTNPTNGAVVPAYILETNQLYKVFKNDGSYGWSFTIKIDYWADTSCGTYQIPLPEVVSKNQNEVKFKLIDVQDSSDLGKSTLKIIYELNDKLTVYQPTLPLAYSKIEGSARVEGLSKVYLVKEESSPAVPYSSGTGGGVDEEAVDKLILAKGYATKTQVNSLITITENTDGTINLVINPIK